MGSTDSNQNVTKQNVSNSFFHELPAEILVEILHLLPGSYLVRTCRCVCKKWKSVVDSQSLWAMKCRLDNVTIPPRIEGDTELDYRHLHFYNPYGRNLLKNWNAEEGFVNWTVIQQGGDGFCVEDDTSSHSVQPLDQEAMGCECHNWWATSYHTCQKGQMIDLLHEGCSAKVLDVLKPDIVISVWTAARRDCASEFNLEVKLKSAKKKTIDAFNEQRLVAQWQNGEWVQITHTLSNYPSGVRYIAYEHGGQDNQFWAGHYGSKIATPSVRFHFKPSTS